MSMFLPVIVTAVRFTRQFDEIPLRFELDGVSYDLKTPYKKVIIKSDEGTVATFDVSDGTHLFRLRQGLFGWGLLQPAGINS